MLIDDDPGVLALLTRMAAALGFSVHAYESPAQALEAASLAPPDAALVDFRLPGCNGIDVLRDLKRAAPRCDVLLMSGFGSIESAVEALKLGARDYLCKPFDMAALAATLDTLRRQAEGREAPRAETLTRVPTFEGMVGASPVMADLFELIRRVAPHFTTALVSGETGTGKELVARALHRLGRRRDRPFLTVNCSAIVETLFESELFGHTRGAFTGAVDSRAGLFERAHGGMLFLDEIGELPPAMQAKLLRTLETGEVAKVGSREVRHVDVHVVAATNRVLDTEVGAGRFRADLFYRLNAVELRVPPLRERREDVLPIAEEIVFECARQFGRDIVGIAPAAAEQLLAWSWPGNVRELRNMLERACMLAEGSLITPRDLRLGTRAAAGLAPATAPAVAAVRPIAAIEREEIERALVETRGNKKEAARRLGISRRALYRRLEKFALHCPDSRDPGAVAA
jgi:two-component system response regulator HydG